MANNLNFFRGKYSDYLALKDEGKVLDTNLYFTIPDDEDKKITNDPKSSSYCLYQGEILLASATHESDIKGILSELESITSRIDNIGSEIATYTISAITPTDKTVEKEYALMKTQGDTTIVEGETIKIYKDSALKNVEMVNANSGTTQYLSFTYTLADGSDKVVNFDVSSLLVASEFKEGLQVSENGEVSVKVASATKTNTTPKEETNKNFLSLDNNGLAVKSVDSDATVLHQNLTVAGLSGSFGAGNYSNGTVISAGTSLYTILENILCKESYPTVSYKSAALSTAIKAPSIKFTKTGSLVYGTTLQFSGSCNALVVSTTPNQVYGLTDGYSAADDDTPDSSNTSITENVVTAHTSGDSTYRLSATFSGFNNQSSLSGTGSTNAACVINLTTLGYVTMGDNKVTLTATGPSISGTAQAISSGYTVSNLKKTDSRYTYSGKNAFSHTCTKPTSASTSTVTGVLPCFANVSGGALVDTPAQLSLTTGKEFTITVPSEVAAKKHFVFDFPADRTVSSFKVKDLQGNFVAFEAAYSQSTDVEKTINGFTMKYKRLTTTGDYVGDGVYKITLSTNLNSADMTKVLKNNNQ